MVALTIAALMVVQTPVIVLAVSYLLVDLARLSAVVSYQPAVLLVLLADLAYLLAEVSYQPAVLLVALLSLAVASALQQVFRLAHFRLQASLMAASSLVLLLQSRQRAHAFSKQLFDNVQFKLRHV